MISSNLFTFLVIGSLTLLLSGSSLPDTGHRSAKDRYVTFTADPKENDIRFFLKNAQGTHFANIGGLKKELNSLGIELLFAMNGGMFTESLNPLGLYIENGELIEDLNTVEKAYGNFYLQPNGVFFITRNRKALVKSRQQFKFSEQILYATQSGPMLLVDGEVHPAFNKASMNLNIRNGVGILPDGSVLFALSKSEVNFFDFATFFKDQGCQNALYLDGVVSRAYLPDKNWIQLEGNLGVIIGVTRNQ